MAAGNTTGTIVIRATVLMLAAWVIGSCIGSIAQRTIEENLDEYRQLNPILSQDLTVNAERDAGAQSMDVEDPPVQTEPNSAAEAA